MAAQGGGAVVSVSSIQVRSNNYRWCRPVLILSSAEISINAYSCSSIQGTRGFPNFPAYAATKAGMQGLTRQLAVDYAHQGFTNHM